LIPSLPWEVSSSPSTFLLQQFDDVVQDLHLYIFSYLDMKSIRNIMAVNHKYHQLILLSESHLLWVQYCQPVWNPSLHQDTHLVDSMNLPTAAGVFQEHVSNLSLLLSMTPNELLTWFYMKQKYEDADFDRNFFVDLVQQSDLDILLLTGM
jgi:hypothetical protein